MTTTADTFSKPVTATSRDDQTSPAITLAVALLGFFVVTFDAVVVNVALPTIRHDSVGGSPGCSGWSTATRCCSPPFC